MKTKISNFHDKNYKLLLLIPAILLVFSFIYLGVFYSNNGDFMYKDVSLTGGTSVTIYDSVNAEELELAISSQLEDVSIRQAYDLITREQISLEIETRSDKDYTKQVLEDFLGYELIPGTNSDFVFTGSSLSESFYSQLLIAILFAFIFMAIVVFILFRTLIPSTAVIISAFADILMTLVFVDLIGMKMSTAGIVAFLMLIGYSVDTDILLTTRLLKRHGASVNSKIYGAFKTGITMTLTSLLAVLLALFVVRSFSIVLTQIFTILAIGLGFDILNTWITNVSILKWYIKSKK
jgi:preprotein translocase subunit SecF